MSDAIDPELERLGINVIRGLAMDAPAKAKSGHQGTAMALAPLAHVLFTRVMRYDAGGNLQKSQIGGSAPPSMPRTVSCLGRLP